MNTVWDLFETLLDPTGQYGPWASHENVSGLKATPLNSHVGEVSRLIITKAREFLSTTEHVASRHHPVILQHVLNAVVHSINILVHG